MKSAFAGLALLTAIATGGPSDSLEELIALAKPVGEGLAFTNDYVRVGYAKFEYPPAERRVAEARPLVLYIRVAPGPGRVHTQLLEPPRKGRPSWRPGAAPRAIHIELLKPPPRPSRLGEAGTSLPREAVAERPGNGVQLVLATFSPFQYGVGTGRLPSVTTFLSDGVVDVSSQGLRRRMAVQAGDAFWFEAHTRLTVIDDYPVGVAILQISPR
jgi:hypothetical protein